MSIKNTFMRYILTNIIGMIGLSCYILADTFFVSNGLGVQGLTALNLSISIYSFINATGLLIGIGGATKYSIYQARNKHNKANIIFTNSIKIGILLGIFFLLIGLFGSSTLSSLLGADKNIFHMTNTYLKTLLCFTPFFILNNIFIAFIRNDGNPKLSMAGMLIGSLSNIILDYFFIFPLQWGMFGAAFATGLAPIISMCILTKHYIKKKNHFHFHKSKLSIKQVTYICSLGVSSFITEIASGIILIVFNLLILNISGNIGVAAYGIVANLALVATSIFTGIAQGTQPLLSENFGQGNNKKILQLFKYAIYASLVVSIVLYALIVIFNNQLVEIFNTDHIKILSKTASTGLIIYFAGFFFAGINIITSAVLSSINEPRHAFTISILRSGCIIVPITLFLSYFFQMIGIWLSFPLSEIITLIVGVFLAKKSLKRL
ncbi:MATE family efflux transporter [Clostridium sporogenes]|uniref:MATE family efflux transporter n=1 Tax=Clostridium sporogenes TaxID=1509 RepID=UPI001F3D57F2|nr:MATE family efflux transporter [Clostridium sporogenes]MCF4017403.1 MATE family efflux transporter [Clostridium sporogenes]